MKIMKKEEIIKNNLIHLLKRETRILHLIKDAHPFILNLVGVIQTQVSTQSKLVRLFKTPVHKFRVQFTHKFKLQTLTATFVKLGTAAPVILPRFSPPTVPFVLETVSWEHHQFLMRVLGLSRR